MTVTDSVKRLLSAGKHPSDVRLELSCSRSLISRCREELGIPKFRRGPRSKVLNSDRAKRMAKLKQWGFTYSQIGKLYSISGPRVCAILHGNQIKSGGGRCVRCKRKFKSLHRNHLDYISNVTERICGGCHRKYHRKEKINRLN